MTIWCTCWTCAAPSHACTCPWCAGPQLGDEDVQFAADLAAFFSKARDDLKCDVIVCRAGELKKPKGAKPGQVMVGKEMGNVVARPGQSIAAVSGVGTAAAAAS